MQNRRLNRSTQPRFAADRAGRWTSRLFGRRRVALGSLLAPPVVWLLIVYIASLAMLVVAAFFRLDPRSQRPTSDPTTANVIAAFSRSEFLIVVWRSFAVAVGVTVISALVAVPVSFFAAKVAPRWIRRGLVVAFLMPLWAGYLVKAYAWKAMLRPGSKFGVDTAGGFLQETFGWTPGFGWVAVVLSLTYLWLPYMLIPVYTGIERLPDSLLEASADLGSRPAATFWHVVAPSLLPSIAAGSIFTFSLSLGDYIIPSVVTERKVRMVGNVIESTLLAPNQPLAAALTLWPLAIIVVYLLAVRRAGGMDEA